MGYIQREVFVHVASVYKVINALKSTEKDQHFFCGATKGSLSQQFLPKWTQSMARKRRSHCFAGYLSVRPICKQATMKFHFSLLLNLDMVP